ncbi:DUF983 domain-containing protein [Phenylobacterium aquaticum]|nr:DUF983 domain-containing protein [Phenylobacterium aquaticum]
MSSSERPNVLRALTRGLKGRCPHCGEGKMYWRYLKVEPACPACGHSLSQYPADDGPAYFTILIVAHLFVAPLLLFPVIWQAPPLLMVPGALIPLGLLTLILLPRIKGAFIGVLYAMGVKEADQALHSADLAE